MEPGSSSGGSSARGVVSDQGREEKQKEMREKLSEVCGVGEEEEEEDDDKSNGIASGFVPGPLVSLKEQIDKDKDDESLRRWKEKLLGCLENDLNGLTYSNTVWKGGLQVDQSKGMLGTFAPNKEPYVHTLEEETTPSGLLARGIYSAKLKFEDDDRRSHMELQYAFEIKKTVS
ncbi:hypothetical protein PRUPE_8G218800 [Prunus persica]|uniref:Rho GDP-dissociation inhibitor 1 n=1 Tax=Prunus persica TaxID=3760 RepID=A0A251N3N5_PRUPE|nr:hypothetical protein PRUPE_8G218800 [Prunus persica]